MPAAPRPSQPGQPRAMVVPTRAGKTPTARSRRPPGPRSRALPGQSTEPLPGALALPGLEPPVGAVPSAPPRVPESLTLAWALARSFAPMAPRKVLRGRGGGPVLKYRPPAPPSCRAGQRRPPPLPGEVPGRPAPARPQATPPGRRRDAPVPTPKAGGGRTTGCAPRWPSVALCDGHQSPAATATATLGRV